MARSPLTKPKVGRPSWRIRRRIVVATLLFCAGEIVYLSVWGRDSSLNETIAMGVLILAASVIGSYVFGATWDDSNVMRFKERGTDPYADEVDTDEDEPPRDFAG